MARNDTIAIISQTLDFPQVCKCHSKKLLATDTMLSAAYVYTEGQADKFTQPS